MSHTFKLDKPGNITATFERLKQKLSTIGGKLTGNEEEGTILVEGVEGRYVVESDVIKITITRKPASIIPNRLIENQIRSIFQEIRR